MHERRANPVSGTACRDPGWGRNHPEPFLVSTSSSYRSLFRYLGDGPETHTQRTSSAHLISLRDVVKRQLTGMRSDGFAWIWMPLMNPLDSSNNACLSPRVCFCAASPQSCTSDGVFNNLASRHSSHRHPKHVNRLHTFSCLVNAHPVFSLQARATWKCTRDSDEVQGRRNAVVQDVFGPAFSSGAQKPVPSVLVHTRVLVLLHLEQRSSFPMYWRCIVGRFKTSFARRSRSRRKAYQPTSPRQGSSAGSTTHVLAHYYRAQTKGLHVE